MKVFLFDNGTNSVIVNEPEVLLIKEFAALWTNERNRNGQTQSSEPHVGNTEIFKTNLEHLNSLSLPKV